VFPEEREVFMFPDSLPSFEHGLRSTSVMDPVKLHDTSCKCTSVATSVIAVLQIFQRNEFQY